MRWRVRMWGQIRLYRVVRTMLRARSTYKQAERGSRLGFNPALVADSPPTTRVYRLLQRHRRRRRTFPLRHLLRAPRGYPVWRTGRKKARANHRRRDTLRRNAEDDIDETKRWSLSKISLKGAVFIDFSFFYLSLHVRNIFYLIFRESATVPQWRISMCEVSSGGSRREDKSLKWFL